MLIFGQEITEDQMPSFVKPQDQPYHVYQSMQETLMGKLQQGQVIPMNAGLGNPNSQPSQWQGGGK